MAERFLEPNVPLKKINNETGDIDYIYPQTTASQVIMNEDGERLNTILTENILYLDDTEDGGSTSINADTLGGYEPSYFAVRSNYDSNNDDIVDNADNGIFEYTHSKNGTVHNLQGSGFHCEFWGRADWNPGDTMTVNGIRAECYNQNMERIENEELFKTNGWVDIKVLYVDWVEGTEPWYNCFFKSGGTGLKLKVVGGTTQPASPKENTIWINTDKEISYYEIGSIKNPGWDGGSDGWTYIYGIFTDYSGLNLLDGKNFGAFYFQPVTAYQYSDGIWTERKIKWYGKTNNTETTQWNDTAFLYLKGNEATFLTGGWNPLKGTSSATLTKSSTSLDVSGGNNYSTGWITAQKVDLSQINSITISGAAKYSSNQFNVVEIAIGIMNNIPSALEWANFEKYAVASGGTANTLYDLTTTIDVSSYSGSYYIAAKYYSAVTGQIFSITYN